MFDGREPTAVTGGVSELVRQVLPALVVLGVIQLDGTKQAAVFMIVSAFVAFANIWITRSQVTPVITANEQIQIGINSPKNTKVSEVVEAQKEGLDAVK